MKYSYPGSAQGLLLVLEKQLPPFLFSVFDNVFCVQHFKDIMQIRRTDGTTLGGRPSTSGASAEPENEGAVEDADSSINLPRSSCVSVMKQLVVLMLSMDFTCDSDLFLLNAKVTHVYHVCIKFCCLFLISDFQSVFSRQLTYV